VIEKVAQHLLTPAERRAGATRGSTRSGPRLRHRAGPLGTRMC
jgi:hypothetical protein